MSFFEDPKNAGMAIIIVGILEMVFAVISIVLGLIGIEDDDGTKYFSIGSAVGAIGSLICGFIYFGFGKRVKGGAIPEKIDILATFVRIVGVCVIIGGIFSCIGNIVDDVDDIGGEIVGGIITILLGILICWVAGKINDGRQTTGDKVIWIILLVIFVLCIIMAVIEMLSIIGIVFGICHLIIYVFMLMLLLNADVKAAMGM